jgi:uncharacterized protein YndB with AHSA1/START domain
MNLIELSVSRAIPAPAEEIFDVWMDPKSPGGPWYGVHRVILNPVVDGLFHFAVLYGGKEWPHYGRFLKIERPQLVEYTWVSEATKGVESVVSVSFEPKGDETEVTLRHSRVPDDEMGRQHKEGWDSVLSALAQSIAARHGVS